LGKSEKIKSLMMPQKPVLSE